MGLKTTNYELKNFGITIPEAYARLTDVSITLDGNAYGVFKIYQSREDAETNQEFERQYIQCKINKELPVHRQIYLESKEKIFLGWKDDIV